MESKTETVKSSNMLSLLLFLKNAAHFRNLEIQVISDSFKNFRWTVLKYEDG